MAKPKASSIGYRTPSGGISDAKLHEEIMDGVDDTSLRVMSAQRLMKLGMTRDEVQELYEVKIPLDLHDELGSLLCHVADVSMAIRYLGQHWDRPDSPTNVVWLADSLHKLCHLGEAIKSRNPDAIVKSCDWLIADYESFMRDENIKEVFARQRGVNLDDAIRVLGTIRRKAA